MGWALFLFFAALLKRIFMKTLFPMFVIMLSIRESMFYCAAGGSVWRGKREGIEGVCFLMV